MDEPTKTAEESSEETTTQESPTVEKETTEHVEEEKQEETPDQSNQEPEPQQGQEKPKRAVKRLHQLLDKYGDGDKGESQDSQDMPSRQTLDTPPWYEPQVQPEQEITPDQYKADVARTAQEIAALEIKKFQAQQAQKEERIKSVNKFASTVNELESKYPVLKEGSESYNEGVADKVARLYEKASGKQPNADLLKDIVETVMETSERSRDEGQSSVTKALIDQAGQEAIRPGGNNSKSELSQQDMQELKRKNPGKLAEYLSKKLSWSEE